MKRIELVKGDITKQEVDVIVNAAHEGLCGGGGVDGAIHKAAGSMMSGECMNLPENSKGERCPIGKCRMTSGYKLPALYILHTVGPVWRGGKHDERTNLSFCYKSCIRMAQLQGLHKMAFPCISTGAFNFPKKDAAEIAFNIVRDWFEYQAFITPHANDVFNETCNISLIRFVCFDNENYNEYLKLMPEKYMDIE